MRKRIRRCSSECYRKLQTAPIKQTSTQTRWEGQLSLSRSCAEITEVMALEERGGFGGARLHHGVQRCCQGPGLVSLIRRRFPFTSRTVALGNMACT